MNNLKADFICI